MSLVDPLPSGAFTMLGKTTGPAINLGRNRYNKSQMVYMHVDEIRDACVRAGLHTEHDYQLLLAERDGLLEKADEAAEVLVDQSEKIEALEKMLGLYAPKTDVVPVKAEPLVEKNPTKSRPKKTTTEV